VPDQQAGLAIENALLYRNLEEVHQELKEAQTQIELLQRNATELAKLRGETARLRADAQGIGFAISLAAAKPIADQLVATGKVVYPYLGTSDVDLNPAIAAQLGITERDGIVIRRVVRGSPADQAGLQRLDSDEPLAVALAYLADDAHDVAFLDAELLFEFFENLLRAAHVAGGAGANQYLVFARGTW
jgi:hypothetical protein